jgi:hypothetical protein
VITEVVMEAVATTATDLQVVVAEDGPEAVGVAVVVAAMGEAEVDTEVVTVTAHPVEEVGVEAVAVAVEVVDGIEGL